MIIYNYQILSWKLPIYEKLRSPTEFRGHVWFLSWCPDDNIFGFDSHAAPILLFTTFQIFAILKKFHAQTFFWEMSTKFFLTLLK